MAGLRCRRAPSAGCRVGGAHDADVPADAAAVQAQPGLAVAGSGLEVTGHVAGYRGEVEVDADAGRDGDADVAGDGVDLAAAGRDRLDPHVAAGAPDLGRAFRAADDQAAAG